jgi:hypothetical protein
VKGRGRGLGLTRARELRNRSKVFQQSDCLLLVSNDQAQVLDIIQRFANRSRKEVGSTSRRMKRLMSTFNAPTRMQFGEGILREVDVRLKRTMDFARNNHTW